VQGQKITTMKKLLNFGILFIISQYSIGQILPQWTATYGNDSTLFYEVNDMVTDKAGNSYVYGYEEDTAYHDKGIIIKYNSNGIQQWLNTMNGLGSYGKIKTDKAGNVYIISRYDSIASSDFLTIKYNANGILEWKAIYNGPANGNDTPSSITFDDSLNVYVTGSSSNSSYFNYNFTTIKYDSSGAQKWVAIFDYSYEWSYDIAVDSLHNVYVTGSSLDSINGNLITIKYDPSGNVIWTKRFLDNINSYGKFIDISADGFVYVGGVESSNGGSDYLCIKYDTSGNKLWSVKYDAQDTLPWNAQDSPEDMKLDLAGNVYFTGTQFVGNNPNDAYCTVKFSSDGILQWAKSYKGGNGVDEAFSLDVDNQGNVYVFGDSQDSLYNNNKIFVTIKYDNLGNIIWIAKFDSVQQYNSFRATSIGIDSFCNVYVTGVSSNLVSPHFVTLKYSFDTGINEVPYNNLFCVYPNPSINFFNFEFSHRQNKRYYFYLYNIIGQPIQIIDNINSDRLIIDGSNFKNGIYFYQLFENDFKIANGKLIKI